MRDASRRRPTRPGTPTGPPPGTPPGQPADGRTGGPRAGLRPGVRVVAALAPALLIAGCSRGADGEAGARQTADPTAREVFLEPAAAQGPAPFTPSTTQEGAPAQPDEPPAPGAPASAAPGSAPAGRALSGATPGLYGGTRSTASCNVEQQVSYLTGDAGRARAFAEAAGIPEARLADWLRGLTPVLLRADARVTSHGFRDGHAAPVQSVLQEGTAVLVDQYGSPRVRCAGGNPLRSPAPAPGAPHKGRPWSGYRPDRVVAITPTSTVLNSLIIASTADNTWIERRTGSDGEADRLPDAVPSCDPASCDLVNAPPLPLPDTAGPPRGPDGPARPAGPGTGNPAGPGAPTGPDGSGVPAPESVAPRPGDGAAVPVPDGPGAPDGPDAPAGPGMPGVPDGPGAPGGLTGPDGPGVPDGQGGLIGPGVPDGLIAPDGSDTHPAPEPPASFDGPLPGDPGPGQPLSGTAQG